MKSHPAVKELKELFPENPEVIDAWVNKWFVEISKTQSVINKKYIDSPYEDFIIESIAHNMIDRMIEKMLEYDVDKNSYTASLIGLRRRKPDERN